jgi:hypothetical protein
MVTTGTKERKGKEMVGVVGLISMSGREGILV